MALMKRVADGHLKRLGRQKPTQCVRHRRFVFTASTGILNTGCCRIASCFFFSLLWRVCIWRFLKSCGAFNERLNARNEGANFENKVVNLLANQISREQKVATGGDKNRRVGNTWGGPSFLRPVFLSFWRQQQQQVTLRWRRMRESLIAAATRYLSVFKCQRSHRISAESPLTFG